MFGKLIRSFLFIHFILTVSIPLAMAQVDYPTKPIQLIVPYPGGGTSTLAANVVAEKMGEILGKPVVIVNKPGGGTALGIAFAANAKPDGYTILLVAGPFVTMPLTTKEAPFKIGDFTPIGRISTGDFILAVHRDIPASNVKEFIAYCQKNPGKLSYVAGSPSSLPRLGAELLKDRLKIEAQYIPYDSPSASLPALLGGHVQFGVIEALPAVSHIRARTIKPIAIFSNRRNPSLPEVPTFKEAGYPDVVTYTFFMLVAPAKTPVPVVKKLENALKIALEDRAVQQKLNSVDVNPDFLNADETRAFIEAEIKKWSEIIRRRGIEFQE